MVVRGIGLGMVFIPLNNLALGNLAPNKLAQASGIYNLLRQLGGSVGIALSATLYSFRNATGASCCATPAPSTTPPSSAWHAWSTSCAHTALACRTPTARR